MRCAYESKCSIFGSRLGRLASIHRAARIDDKPVADMIRERGREESGDRSPDKFKGIGRSRERNRRERATGKSAAWGLTSRREF